MRINEYINKIIDYVVNIKYISIYLKNKNNEFTKYAEFLLMHLVKTQ